MGKLLLAGLTIAVSVLLAAADVCATVAWNEAISGDLSGDTEAPTSLGQLGVGTHSILVTTGGGNADIVTFHIPDELHFTAMTASNYTGGSGETWLELAAGATIPDRGIEFGNLLGYGRLGAADADVMALLRNGAGAMGFDPPLEAGDYSFLMQEFGSPGSFQIDLVVNNPEPGSALMLNGAAIVAFTTRRRRA